MTIAELIEYLCLTIGDMAALINKMAERLLQSDMIHDDELKAVEEIQRRIRTIKIGRDNTES